jgi:hypothetical protein
VRASFDTFAFEPLAWSRQDILDQAQSKASLYQALVQHNDISLD